MRNAALMLLAALCGATSPVLAEDEDVNAREPLSELVAQLNSSDSSARSAAMTRIQKRVPAIDPSWVVVGMNHPDIELAKQLKPLVGQLVDLMTHADEDVREVAGALLTAAGHEAQEAIPALEQLMVDSNQPSNRRFEALSPLLHIAPEDKPVGPIFLKCFEAHLQSLSKEELDELDFPPQTDPFAEEKIDHRFTGAALSATGVAMGLVASGHTKVEVPSLLEAASSKYPGCIRLIALLVLAELGPEANAAVPGLRKLLDDKSKVISIQAALAIISIEEKRELAAQFADRLNLNSEERQKFLQWADDVFVQTKNERELLYARDDRELGELTEQNLVELRFGNGCYRRHALRAIKHIGPPAAATAPAIREALNNADEETRQLAREALERIGAAVGHDGM